MPALFDMDRRDLKKLKRFMKQSPKEFQKATAGVLNSLAFGTRKNDIKNISRSMIVRNKQMTKTKGNPFLQVQMAKRGLIEGQIAIAGSVKKKGFSGWTEQQTGKPPKKKRTATIHSRRGNKRNVMKAKARLKAGNKFYKPEQFQGRSLLNRFYFMMRVLGRRGGGEFLLSQSIPTKRGRLGRGLYELVKEKEKGSRGGKINRLQSFQDARRPKRNEWRTLSLKQLVSGNNIKKIWTENIKRIMNRYK